MRDQANLGAMLPFTDGKVVGAEENQAKENQEISRKSKGFQGTPRGVKEKAQSCGLWFLPGGRPGAALPPVCPSGGEHLGPADPCGAGGGRRTTIRPSKGRERRTCGCHLDHRTAIARERERERDRERSFVSVFLGGRGVSFVVLSAGN